MAQDNTAQLRRKLAQLTKTANQRLRQLEKSGYTGSSKAYQYVERLGFDGDKALTTTGKGELKFLTSFKGLSYPELKHLQAEVNRFLTARTSTVTGIKGIVEGNKAQFEQITGQKLTQQEYAELWIDTTAKLFKELYGSQELTRIVKVYGNEKAMVIMQKAVKYAQENGTTASVMQLDTWGQYTQYQDKENPFL